jgi:RNA polymerase sigma-32 factor
LSATSLSVARHDNLLAGPLGSFDAYAERVSRIPVLTREQEVELAARFRQDEDLDAARTLVMSHLRFVLHIARGYSGYGLPIGDLVQEGNVGLMKAVKRFDPEMGVRLVSFAVHWIRAEIHDYVLRNWRLVKIATTKAQLKLVFNLRRRKKNLAWLTLDETEAVARDLGVTVAEVTEMEKRLSARDLAFDPAPDSDDDESYGPSVYLPAPDADLRSRLAGAVSRLDARSQGILQRRWIAEDKATLHELADEYGISAERVRQIEVAALKRLKTLMAG